MSGEFREAIQVIRPVLPPAAAPAELLPGVAPVALNAEQTKALDAVFAQLPAADSQAGMLGFLSAGMLLNEIIKDTLAPPADEGEPEEKKKLPEPLN
jgi:hypothetical protein